MLLLFLTLFASVRVFCSADNTAEVGLIKLIKSARISDGIVRLYYVAGEHALGLLNRESDILDGLTSSWGIAHDDILPTASRFFDGYKKYQSLCAKQNSQILDLQMKVFLLDPAQKAAAFESSEANPTLFISNMPQFAAVSVAHSAQRCARFAFLLAAPPAAALVFSLMIYSLFDFRG